jgi:hypothetical protein
VSALGPKLVSKSTLNGSRVLFPVSHSLSCKFSHDIKTYLASKSHDLFWPPPTSSTFLRFPPYLPPHTFVPSPFDPSISIDLETSCPNGFSCTFGYKCRFLGGHIEPVPPGADATQAANALTPSSLGFKLIRNPEPEEVQERNRIDVSRLKLMRSKKVSLACFDLHVNQPCFL